MWAPCVVRFCCEYFKVKSTGSVLLNRYTITERIGSGGMAQVYRAFDAHRGHDVAIKILSDECAASPQLRERFINEFTLLTALNHPRIVTVYELHENTEEAPFFSMQLLAGTTLASRKVGTAEALSVSQLLTALSQIAGALEYLHAEQIMYCDLKSDNIIVNVHENTLTTTLIDFGVSSRTSPTVASTKTQANLLGTSLYMSPEAIRGEAPAPGWDIYSFGALAFELLTGHVPFEQKELFSVTASHLLGKVPDISHYNPDLPRGMNRFIEICLAKVPADRYQSMTEIRERLTTLNESSSSRGILGKLVQFWHAYRGTTAVAHARTQTSAQHNDGRPLSEEESRLS